MLTSELHLVCSLLMLASSVVPIYLSVKLRGNYRKLTVILSIFVLVHAAYHITDALGINFLSESIFEPLSILALISFGLFYLKSAKNTGKKMVIEK